MIQEEFWLTRLAEATQLQASSTELLWSAFCTQLEQRLLSGSSLYIPQLGVWELQEHREQVAHTADGKYWLIPPQLTLGIRSETERTPRSVSILLLGELLTQQTQLAPSAVQSWLEQIGSLTRELLLSGASVSWPRLGTLTPRATEGQDVGGFAFLPQQSFLAQLNKPFSMFSPVEISPEAITPELSLSEYPTLEAIYPLVPLWVSFASLANAPEEDTPQEEAPQEELPLVAPPKEEIPEEETPEKKVPEEEAPQPIAELGIPVAPSVSEQTEEDQAISPQEHSEVATAPSPAPPATASPEEQPQRLFWVVLALGITFGIGFLYLLLTWTATSKPSAPPQEKVASIDSLPTVTQPAPDSLTAQPDSLPVARETLTPEAPTAPKPAPRKLHPEAERTEQVRLHAGDRLSRLALKKYGHKAFWVYIYEENRDKLRDPDNIPVGVTIILPPASKYRIDAQDTNSVARALLLQRQLQQ